MTGNYYQILKKCISIFQCVWIWNIFCYEVYVHLCCLSMWIMMTVKAVCVVASVYVSDQCWVNMLCELVCVLVGQWGGLMETFIYSSLFEGATSPREGYSHQAHMALLNTLHAHTHTHAHTFQATLHCLSFLKSYPCLETVLAGKTSRLKHQRNPPPPYSAGH